MLEKPAKKATGAFAADANQHIYQYAFPSFLEANHLLEDAEAGKSVGGRANHINLSQMHSELYSPPSLPRLN